MLKKLTIVLGMAVAVAGTTTLSSFVFVPEAQAWSIKKAAKKVGRTAKKGGKYIGRKAKKGGKFVGRTAKKGGKRVGRSKAGRFVVSKAKEYCGYFKGLPMVPVNEARHTYKHIVPKRHGHRIKNYRC